MYKKNKKIVPLKGLTATLLLFFCIPFGVKADHPKAVSYKLRNITIASTGAMEPMATKPYPCLHLAKWITPTTHSSLINTAINLSPGEIFDAKILSSIKQRLIALPYFSTLSVTRKVVDPNTSPILSDLIIKTKDQFPITLEISLDEGPLLTITHANVNVWGYGHSLSQAFFLKKRWGYGLTYELPKLAGNYLFGGHYYKQIEPNYTFKQHNLWLTKLFAIKEKESAMPCYWVTGLSGYKKRFITPLSVWAVPNKPYDNYMLILGKIGWVADGYEKIRGIYTLHALGEIPKGGSVAILYGYQKGVCKNRHYIGLDAIKNISNPRLRYMHISCESGSFINKNSLEEAIIKFAFAYVGPPIRRCNNAHQSIAIKYIIGYRMPKKRILGIMYRDPESLEAPDKDNSMAAPIHARLNLYLNSTLHRPIVLSSIRFVVLGFTNFIALVNQDNQLLNHSFVDTYGIGLHLEHATKPWPGLEIKLGYSPLLGKLVPSIKLAIASFKNKKEANPTVVPYS